MGGKGRLGGAWRLACALALACGILANGHAQPSVDQDLAQAIRDFESAVGLKDMERALSAWRFETAEAAAEERNELAGVFSYQQVTLSCEPPAFREDGQGAVTFGTLAEITEPRGSIAQWGLLWEKTPLGWRIISRRAYGGIDGLVHLTLDPRGYAARGQTIELEDFSLQMLDGTFYLNTQEAGPTSLVFVGKGRVVFKPRPRTEQGQMRIFAKSEVLDDEVSQAFLRLHPADLYRTLKPGEFVDDPKSAERFAKAREFFERQKNEAFVLDASVAGAPWWLLPGLGDAAIVFDTRHFGLLTLSLSSFDAEGVNLFNRKTARQIVVYPRADAADQDRGEEPELDVTHHDLSISLNPETFDLSATDVMRVDFRSPLSLVRFHLDDALQVRSVRSEEGGRHLFFRVRGQNSILVSMGALAGFVGELNLTVDYIGRLPTGTVESEILQAGPLGAQEDPSVFIDPALIYSRRQYFYPQPGEEDYATSTLKVTVPADWTVVSGGLRSEVSDNLTRTVTYTQSRLGKYIAFLAARLVPIGSERTEAFSFDAYAQGRARREGERAVANMKGAAVFYEHLFGPLPYAPLNMALVEAPVPGGHSPPGLVIVQQRPPLLGGGLKDDPATFYDIPGFFLAHELAHQWWGHGVTPASYRHRWVSEGFAQYAAALWARDALGEEVFVRVLRKMVAWSRRLGALGPVDLGNRVGHIQGNAQAQRAVVYDKGALVLDMVRRLIGDEAFRRGLIRLQREHRFQKVDSEMVRRAFESESQASLDPLWEVFVRDIVLPTMRLERGPDGVYVVVEGYQGPLPVTVQVDDQRKDLIVAGRLQIPGAGLGARVVLDPDGVSLVKESR